MKLTNENFKEVLANEACALVLIGGEGCANCITMYPLVKNIENTREEIKVFYIEVDETNCDINEYYDVELVPSVLITKNAELISKIRGYQPPEIFEMYVDAKIEECKR